MPRIIQGVNQFIYFPFIMVKNRNWMIVKMSLLKTRPKRILKGHIIIIMRGGYGGIGEGLCVLKHFEPITLLIIIIVVLLLKRVFWFFDDEFFIIIIVKFITKFIIGVGATVNLL